MAKRKKLTPTQKEKNRLARKIRSNVKKLNRQLGIIQREQQRGTYASDYQTVSNTVEAMRQLTNTKSEKKLATGRLSHMSLASLQELEAYTEHALSLKVFNTNKRRQMYNQAYATTNARFFPNQKGMTRQQYANMVAMFSSSTVKQYMELHLLDSEQIVEIAHSTNDTSSDELLIKAIDKVSQMFGNNTAKMQRMAKAAPTAFRQLVRAQMIKDDKERELTLRELKSRYSL